MQLSARAGEPKRRQLVPASECGHPTEALRADAGGPTPQDLASEDRILLIERTDRRARATLKIDDTIAAAGFYDLAKDQRQSDPRRDL